MKHTPATAARAVRVLLERDIQKTWAEYNRPGANRANSYQAAQLVCEQVSGVRWRETRPELFREVMPAIETAMPELFAEYWEALP